jgi:hypothetical protein
MPAALDVRASRDAAIAVATTPALASGHAAAERRRHQAVPQAEDASVRIDARIPGVVGQRQPDDANLSADRDRATSSSGTAGGRRRPLSAAAGQRQPPY